MTATGGIYDVLVPNTTLRSRLLGKTLIPRFPSNLPPLTVLDCILDANWRENGILHILDVVKWKGQDICDCEAPFRCVQILETPMVSLNHFIEDSGGETPVSQSLARHHSPPHPIRNLVQTTTNSHTQPNSYPSRTTQTRLSKHYTSTSYPLHEHRGHSQSTCPTSLLPSTSHRLGSRIRVKKTEWTSNHRCLLLVLRRAKTQTRIQ